MLLILTIPLRCICVFIPSFLYSSLSFLLLSLFYSILLILELLLKSFPHESLLIRLFVFLNFLCLSFQKLDLFLIDRLVILLLFHFILSLLFLQLLHLFSLKLLLSSLFSLHHLLMIMWSFRDVHAWSTEHWAIGFLFSLH